MRQRKGFYNPYDPFEFEHNELDEHSDSTDAQAVAEQGLHAEEAKVDEHTTTNVPEPKKQQGHVTSSTNRLIGTVCCVLLLVAVTFTLFSLFPPEHEDMATEELLVEANQPVSTVPPTSIFLGTTTSISTEGTDTPTPETPPGRMSPVNHLSTNIAALAPLPECELGIDVDYSDPRYDNRHHYLCFFNASREGFAMFQSKYGICAFPYMLCHVVLYCCYSLNDAMELVPSAPRRTPIDSVRQMARFKRRNRFLSVYMALRAPSEVFTRILGNVRNEQSNLTDNIQRWAIKNEYDGVHIWWEFPQPGQSDALVEMMHRMSKHLDNRDLTIGLLVPYELNLREGFNVDRLVRVLHRRHSLVFYFADLRLPQPPSPLRWYFSPDANITEAMNITERGSSIIPSSWALKMCFLYPGLSLSYEVDCSNSTSSTMPFIKGPGVQRKYSAESGTLSLSEVCAEVEPSWKIIDAVDHVQACKGMRGLAYLTPDTVGNLVANLYQSLGCFCVGNMHPEFDDFAEQCRFNAVPGPYPLLQGGFRFYKDHQRATKL
ncbi:uncharacterized protein LOC135399553 [Ornithodoros turicata]|uniref:uncharacterized protein LOC135399553 n=1 Tax=Ornithodoros turicata TaxID=34597 RepID=UPI00313992CF